MGLTDVEGRAVNGSLSQSTTQEVDVGDLVLSDLGGIASQVAGQVGLLSAGNGSRVGTDQRGIQALAECSLHMQMGGT